MASSISHHAILAVEASVEDHGARCGIFIPVIELLIERPNSRAKDSTSRCFAFGCHTGGSVASGAVESGIGSQAFGHRAYGCACYWVNRHDSNTPPIVPRNRAASPGASHHRYCHPLRFEALWVQIVLMNCLYFLCGKNQALRPWNNLFHVYE